MKEDIILKIENLSKQYRLGKVGTGTLGHDINRAWAKLRGKEDPYLKIGAVNDRSSTASSDYVWALKDINFEVKRGEIIGIIGKNGAGKSTLLKILSRVTSPTTGSIKVGGRMASLLEVGTGMHPELTGRENIYLNGAILGMTKAEIACKIDEIIDFSGCQMYIDTPVKRYSSGMGVRLGFAVAAFLEPDILVVDEVLAVGDAEFQKKAIGKMQDISSTGGRTVLFVSHNMDSVASLCTRAIHLTNGSIANSGTTKEIISEYLNTQLTHHTDLEAISDRKGNAELLMKKIDLFEVDQSVSKTVFSLGEKLKFILTVSKTSSPVPIESIKIILGIYNEKGDGIIRLEHNMEALTNPTLNDDSNKIIFECNIQDPLTIIPGNYSVNVAIFKNQILADYLSGKILFSIINENYLGSSKLPSDIDLAKIVCRSQWVVR
ncbi:ABC transporter ATP-binding protein [Leeuwenhoekiella sp. H156]|uniref:ABC transporter ATP-binding protein n=1 Tax=Leeuwenhoekiella sp. H156 TaxID=3450128 RepID=UPI003FA47F2C